MGGIAGLLDRRLSPEEIEHVLGQMGSALRHRGPDADGIWSDPSAGLGLAHRRLSIIDISDAGSQPMISTGGRYVIAYNGEVYNFAELRRELAALGSSFNGSSDTEVMLAAIENWGLAAAVSRFVGMFAFALWDRQSRTLSLVRDRLGIKPHFQLIFDDPVSTEEDRRMLFEMISEFPHPYDLYLFSMTVFPGSELNHKLLENGIISQYDIEGTNTRIFYQHRVNLEYPRPVEETFWISLIQMLSKEFVPRSLLRTLSRSSFLRKHPWPLIKMAHGTNYVKMGSLAGKMLIDGEMTKTLWRRWGNMDTVITT